MVGSENESMRANKKTNYLPKSFDTHIDCVADGGGY
jgi:hypothetical protein